MIWFDLFSLEPSNRLQTASGCEQESVRRQRMMEVRGSKMKAVLREGWGQRACQKSVAKLQFVHVVHIFINSWIKINSAVWYSKQTLQHVEKWGLKCETCKTYHRFISCLVYDPNDLYSFLCPVVSSRFISKKSEDECEKETTETSSVQLCTEALHRRNGQNIITSVDHKYLYQMSIHAQKIEIQWEECIICGAWKL